MFPTVLLIANTDSCRGEIWTVVHTLQKENIRVFHHTVLIYVMVSYFVVCFLFSLWHLCSCAFSSFSLSFMNRFTRYCLNFWTSVLAALSFVNLSVRGFNPCESLVVFVCMRVHLFLCFWLLERTGKKGTFVVM